MLLEHGDVAGRSVSIVPEGSEPDEFWAALGGEAEYPKVSEGEVVPQEPRLFQVDTFFLFFSHHLVLSSSTRKRFCPHPRSGQGHGLTSVFFPPMHAFVFIEHRVHSASHSFSFFCSLIFIELRYLTLSRFPE